MSSLLEHFQTHSEWQAVEEVTRTLYEAGHKAYLVGGCVRDALLKRPFNDFDICTDANPDEIEALFDKTLDVGKAFGTIIVILDEAQFEVTTFREDGAYSDGRHPDQVVFSSEEEDAKRRDFTVNALYFDVKADKVVDHVNGLSDLKKEVIRAVGDPEKRFYEDKLRILRAVRFSAQLGWEIEKSTEKAITKYVDELDAVSVERIRDEIDKIVVSWNPVKGLQLLVDFGIYQKVSGLSDDEIETLSNVSLPRMKTLEAQAPFRRTCALTLVTFDLSDERVEVPFKKLKVKTKMTREALRLRQLIRNETLSDDVAVLRKTFASAVKDYFFFLTEGLWSKEARDKVNATYQKYGDQLPKPFVDGNDLNELGIEPGPKMGQLLDSLWEKQLREEVSSRSEALEYIRNEVNS